jgi:hypothetical protein
MIAAWKYVPKLAVKPGSSETRVGASKVTLAPLLAVTVPEVVIVFVAVTVVVEA